jgi:hypothetical protein
MLLPRCCEKHTVNKFQVDAPPAFVALLSGFANGIVVALDTKVTAMFTTIGVPVLGILIR